MTTTMQEVEKLWEHNRAMFPSPPPTLIEQLEQKIDRVKQMIQARKATQINTSLLKELRLQLKWAKQDAARQGKNR
jgi:hypothetical protein